MFLIVIGSVLFSWQEAYEMYYLQCQEDETSAAFIAAANAQSADMINMRNTGASMVSLDH